MEKIWGTRIILYMAMGLLNWAFKNANHVNVRRDCFKGSEVKESELLKDESQYSLMARYRE